MGPAGKLLDRIIANALGPVNAVRRGDGLPDLRLGFTNLVGCMPKDERGAKTGEPEHDQVMACKPRLEEFIALAEPRLICCVGKLAEEYLRPGFRDSVKVPAGVPVIAVVHPAYILRQVIIHQGLLVRRCVVVIRNAAAKLT